MEESKLVEPIKFGVYNECPICGSKMLLLSAHYEASTLASSGYRTGIIDTKDEYTEVCKHCGYTRKMYVTSDQLLRPICGKKELDDEIKTSFTKNPIGK